MSAPDAILDTPAAAEAPLARTRPFYWSVRREVWENGSIYVAPAIAAGVVLIGLLIGAINLPRNVMQQVQTLAPADRAMAIAIPFDIAAAIVLVTSFVVGFFYCLGALHGERRERTILFWKSLPVSDLTTVAAKATVPMLVLPIVTFLVVVAMHLVMLIASTVMLPTAGLPATLLWLEVPLAETWFHLAVLLACMSLWYAPLWGWLLLVSGWAKRVTFLWAVGPPIALSVFEQLAFRTKYVDALIRYRLSGGLTELYAARFSGRGNVKFDDHLDPAKFFSAPGLWIGLVVAAAFFAAVVWQRRYRTPI